MLLIYDEPDKEVGARALEVDWRIDRKTVIVIIIVCATVAILAMPDSAKTPDVSIGIGRTLR